MEKECWGSVLEKDATFHSFKQGVLKLLEGTLYFPRRFYLRFLCRAAWISTFSATGLKNACEIGTQGSSFPAVHGVVPYSSDFATTSEFPRDD